MTPRVCRASDLIEWCATLVDKPDAPAHLHRQRRQAERGPVEQDDLGRLAPGAKADIVLVDLAHPSMRPVRDPIRSLVYSGVAAAVRDVYVGGALVVGNRTVLTVDENAALDTLQAGQARALERVPALDWAGRDSDEMSPLCLPLAPAESRR